MRRERSVPRTDWQRIVESQGLVYHTLDSGAAYWDESAYYLFSETEVNELEQATYALNDMCLRACEYVIEGGRFDLLGLDEQAASLAAASWERDEITLYGRFDLAFGGGKPPKLLEYNADTPTSLLEAAVVQWFWMKDLHPERDQFNTIHDRLLEVWKRFRQERGQKVWFAAMEGEVEDFMTVTYLRDTAIQAGLMTQYVDIEQIGWRESSKSFLDMSLREITEIFKLYPWEWLLRDGFGKNIARAPTRWLEAPWKMVLSNKAILAVLWKLFPDSPFLLPASLDQSALGSGYVRKPFHSREGRNILIFKDGREAVQTPGPYQGPYVYQEYIELPRFDGGIPVLGSWLVNGYAAGVGIREDDGPVSGNASRFIPHLIE